MTWVTSGDNILGCRANCESSIRVPFTISLRSGYGGTSVMSRGDRSEPIFLDDVDRQDWVKKLAEGSQKTGWQVHAYCLRRLHFHLVVETPNVNLVAGMRWLLSAYTIGLNRRHKLFGHVFSGRYQALLVDGSGNRYLKTVYDYVHLNPVRAQGLAWISIGRVKLVQITKSEISP
jgi:putative transposase